MNLTDRKCVPCEGGLPPLDETKTLEYLKELEPGWEVLDSKKISKEFRFNNFKQALDFANKVGAIAEAEGHHPDLHIFYGKVVVDLWTHAIGGLSENDFILAAKFDQLQIP